MASEPLQNRSRYAAWFVRARVPGFALPYWRTSSKPSARSKRSKSKYYLSSIDYNYRISQSIKKKKSFSRFATLKKGFKQTEKQSFILSFYKPFL